MIAKKIPYSSDPILSATSSTQSFMNLTKDIPKHLLTKLSPILAALMGSAAKYGHPIRFNGHKYHNSHWSHGSSLPNSSSSKVLWHNLQANTLILGGTSGDQGDFHKLGLVYKTHFQLRTISLIIKSLAEQIESRPFIAKCQINLSLGDDQNSRI